MELFGIVLSVPAAFILSAVYVGLLRKFVQPHVRLRQVLQVTSLLVVCLVLVEAALVVSVGVLKLRAGVGPAYYGVHLVLFLTAIPALANVLALRMRKLGWVRGLAVSAACGLFAVPVVLVQHGVSEGLYGIDGDNGPFSAASGSRRAVIDDLTSDRAQILTVDGNVVERMRSKYVTAIPVALVAPGEHTFLVKLRSAEAGGPEDTTSVQATVEGGVRYRFKSVGNQTRLVVEPGKSWR